MNERIAQAFSLLPNYLGRIFKQLSVALLYNLLTYSIHLLQQFRS